MVLVGRCVAMASLSLLRKSEDEVPYSLVSVYWYGFSVKLCSIPVVAFACVCQEPQKLSEVFSWNPYSYVTVRHHML